MSPRRFEQPASESVVDAGRRFRFELGVKLRDARLAKKWSVPELARRASVSGDTVYLIENGKAASAEAQLRLASALGLRLEIELVDPRKKADPRANLGADLVHSAMGEFEARHFRSLGIPCGMDEPYQHYQFAGRGDVVAWDLDARAFLHIENRTRFPDFQEMAGGYNSKRAYLAASLGARLGVRRWASETHVIAALWSAEILHALRLRAESFRAICPDTPDAFGGWWQGHPPALGVTSTLVILDPLATGRQRAFIGLDEALTARPRYRGYAEAAAAAAAGAATAAAAAAAAARAAR